MSRAPLFSLLAAAVVARPMEVRPTEWPLERIVANLEQRLGAKPDDAEVHYNLGRALGFAFALERSSLWGGGGWAVDLDEQRERFRTRPAPAVNAAEALQRLTDGVLHLRRACELAPDPTWLKDRWGVDWIHARKHLTLAWLLETGAHLADRVDTPVVLGVARDGPTREEVASFGRWIFDLGSQDPAVATRAFESLAAPEHLERALPQLAHETCSSDAKRQKSVVALLERAWIEYAIREYRLAYEQNIEIELSPDHQGVEIPRLVSYEALLGYVRLVQKRGVRGADEEARLADLAEKRKALEAHPPDATYVTPIVFSLDCRSLEELTAPDLTVPFDLDGDGIDELWPWLALDAGWLVWDPKHRGEITSGRQMFGTASAWLFFEDGYRVLDALDDDRDGALRGAELASIAVWFDRDTDGISDRGEVVPVEELGIAALRTEATLMIGASPANLCGIEMQDGRVLPTYDWVLAPASP